MNASITSSASALHVSTKAEAVYQELRGRILTSALLPGSMLSQEGLALQLGVSITPLREALRRLETEGLVKTLAHRTMTIPPLTRREVRELYAVRLQLDPLAAKLAAENATSEVIGEIVTLASVAADKEPLTANRRFHRAIYTASKNLVLIELLEQLWNRTDRYRLLVLQDSALNAKARDEHIRIARAISVRESDRVAHLMYEHIEATLRVLERMTADT
jgi:DNA-binding GntR family transcriptional regulator